MATASIREGLDETPTVQRLGLTGAQQRTLRGGHMFQRRVASALVEAEKHFRRVRGYRDLPRLSGAPDAVGAARRRGRGRGVTWTTS